MSYQTQESYQPPWDMPGDVFWDYSDGAELRRLEWIQENHPQLSLREVHTTMPFRLEVIKELLDGYRKERNGNG